MRFLFFKFLKEKYFDQVLMVTWFTPVAILLGLCILYQNAPSAVWLMITALLVLVIPIVLIGIFYIFSYLYKTVKGFNKKYQDWKDYYLKEEVKEQ